MKFTATPARDQGFTLAEMLVTIGIIAVLAAIAIPIYSGVHRNSSIAVANDHVESLNRALINFEHACWKIPTAPTDSASTDEFAVLRTLQWKFPASELKLGSPYFDPNYNPASSSSTSDFRIRWNGRTFELLDIGVAGTGLRYQGSGDYSTPHVFSPGYALEGR